ncbi:unnamed protein product [Mesocestoides corti]|uniref:Ras-related protein Rab-39B n=2 Tax=Mesocestoides corti TaxID=53468 RepID=A0A0R3U6X4_MESCO|nr:unnamed protein product [Mesocestoides corti]
MAGPYFDYQFRLILIGDSTVGKSSLLQYFHEGKLSSTPEPTVGVDFFSRNIILSDGKIVKLRLWDTAGQEKFKSITRSYYRNAVGALLIFDITNRESFDHIKGWYEDASANMRSQQAMFVLCGQKADLENRREVSRLEAEALAQSLGIPYMETSALLGTNVEQAFYLLAESVYNHMQAGGFRNLETVSGWDGIKEGYGSRGAIASYRSPQPPHNRISLRDEAPVSSSCC